MSTTSTAVECDRPRPPWKGPAETAYEMLPIDSDAAHAAVAALAEDRVHLLASQGVTVSASRATALLREPGALGLYEDGLLVGCLVLRTGPDVRHWAADGHDAGLLVALDPATVGTTQVGRLLTLWLADHAARKQLSWVWCEVPSPSGSTAGTSQWLLTYLCDLGWEARYPAVRSPAGGRVVRLRLRAEARAAMAAAISGPHTGATAAVSAP
ncbi:hypothetical protein [Streptomyces candidus]|uniref:N-acetyltransferase domain-containing protein n=1 Tax=Streptomyces candidus TaxID=67283 RepID=A0A7X0HL38_9ACTN|nr:hypothetical protein [Streptomyces candidus]MBB6439674.1 hypothetical protein [Streptomyces candidus]GHH56747.1 hypothetical protein GCM10018773_63180 [Streptomyces candidus]